MPVYFLTCVFLFWIPGLALLTGFWRGLSPARRRAFMITWALMGAQTFAMEYVYLWADIWSFSQAHDPLLGLDMLGAPIEEFAFWFGATLFVLTLYRLLQWFERGRPRIVRRARARG